MTGGELDRGEEAGGGGGVRGESAGGKTPGGKPPDTVFVLTTCCISYHFATKNPFK